MSKGGGRRLKTFSGARTLLGLFKRTYATQRKIDKETASISLTYKRRELLELQCAKASNDLLIQDLQIEKLKRGLGLQENQIFTAEHTLGD